MDARTNEQQIDDDYDDADQPLANLTETTPEPIKSLAEVPLTAEQKEIIDLKDKIKQLETEKFELAQIAEMREQDFERQKLIAKQNAEERHDDLFEKFQASEKLRHEAQEHASFVLEQNKILKEEVSKFQIELEQQFCEITEKAELINKHEQYIQELLALMKIQEQEHSSEMEKYRNDFNEFHRMISERNSMLGDAEAQIVRESDLVLRMQRENLNLACEIAKLKSALIVRDKPKLPVNKSTEPVVTVIAQTQKPVQTKSISNTEKSKSVKVKRKEIDFAESIGNRIRMFFKPQQPVYRNVQHRIQQPNMRGGRPAK